MDKPESFSESRNMARILSGMKGGPFFKPAPVLTRSFVDAWPETVRQKLKYQAIPHGRPLDVWNGRR